MSSWLIPAVILAIVLLISQLWFRRHMIVQHPQRMIVPCLNCKKAITPTINGWTHVRMGGFLCNSAGARPPDLRAPRHVIEELDAAATEDKAAAA